MIAIFKREVRSSFHGMIGYVLTAFMLAATAIYFIALNLGYGLTDFGYYTLYRTVFVLLLYIPVLTMRCFAEERRTRTDQLLLTSPVSVWGIVLGKFLALCVIFALPCLVDAVMILVLAALGASGIATAANFAALLCYFLMGCAAIAIGVFLSSLTENQIIAAVAGVAALLLAYMMPSLRNLFTAGSAVALALFTAIAAVLSVVAGLRTRSFTLGCLTFAGCCVVLTALFLLQSSWLTEAFSAVLSALCLFTPFEEFVNNSFSIPTLVYYLTVIVLFLFFTAQGLEKRRWNGEEDNDMKKFKLTSSANGKVFRSGLYSTAILAAAIVLAVLVNLLVGALPKKYTEFDLSAAKMYTLGDSSRQLMKSLDQDVTVYYLCETGSEDAIVSKLLDHYADESSSFHWEQKDPAIYPAFASQYGAEDVSTGSLIVVSGENSVVLDAAELYEYDYSDYYTTGSANVTFAGEKQISSAIYKLTSGAESHAFYTTNHGEQAPTSSLTEALEAQNIDLQPLDLLTGTIPEDCGLLIINAPASDFASDGLVDEIAQLQAYLENGGKVLLMTSAFVDTPNLDAVMAQFGLAREPGIVVEGDAGHALYGYPYSLFPDHASDDDESTVLDGVSQNTHVMLSVAQGITIAETDGVTAEALLNTTGDAYSKLNYNEAATTAKESGDTDGPFALAAWARNESAGSEVIWVGCPNVDSEQVYQSIPGNLTFLQSCAASLVGQSMLIDTKALEAAPITVAASTSMALGMVFVFVLPAAVLIAGAVVVLLRRRR